MIVTHVEARQMLCPEITRVEAGRLSNCISDKCMMWRDAGEGRGFCGRAVMPLEVMTDTMIAQIKKAVKA